MFVFGGVADQPNSTNTGAVASNDLWRFSASTKTWTELCAECDPKPTPVSLMAMGLIPNETAGTLSIYIFGGTASIYDPGSTSDQFWRIEVSSLNSSVISSWQELCGIRDECASEKPDARFASYFFTCI